MNHMRLQSALKNYADKKGLEKDELIELLNADEKQYTSDEVVEIVAALQDSTNPGSNSGDNGEDKATPEGEYFEEWDVQIIAKQEGDKVVNEAKKLTISRPIVKITEFEAETLNEGVLTGGNTYAKMYFLPE